jgi:hypothetical protein
MDYLALLRRYFDGIPESKKKSTNYLVPTKLFSHFTPQNFILSTLREYSAIHRASPTVTIIIFTIIFRTQHHEIHKPSNT